jgi:heavy metal translocating P-type ATPase
VIRLPAAALHSAAALFFLLAGAALLLGGAPDTWSGGVWTAGLYLTGLPVVFRTVRGALRGRLAADLVATLAIAAAMVLQEPFAGLVVTLMQTGGEALERRAERRATRAVQELEAQAPRIAHRIEPSGRQVDVPVDAVAVGDHLAVRPGEMIPCDGVVESGSAAVDIARVTGEPVPLHGRPGVEVRSGSVVLDGPLTVRATAPARESLYALIVEQVRSAQAAKAPLQRIADRMAIWFTPATLVVCLAAWLGSRDPVRILAVLVVATPCPLILATPVAIIGGINRAARRRIVVRHGGALEGLAGVDAVVFDKTGTLTLGNPEVAAIETRPPWSEQGVLVLAAAVERGAGHPLARSILRRADAEGLVLPEAEDVREAPGRGVTGRVGARTVVIGAWSLVAEEAPAATDEFGTHAPDGGGLRAFVAVDGRAAAVVRFADRPRSEAAAALASMRGRGIRRITLLSGDRTSTAREVGRAVGIAEALGDQRPEDKVRFVTRLRDAGYRVLMVGDGINDAPALSAADVGMALAQHGGGIAAESADVVLLEDDVTRVAEAVQIGRHTMRIARQSLGAGLGLSVMAMIVAAFGYIPPAVGALLQEGIDLAVIANALRAARPGNA